MIEPASGVFRAVKNVKGFFAALGVVIGMHHGGGHKVVRRAVEHMRTAHGETMIRESMVEHIKERIVNEKAADAA